LIYKSSISTATATVSTVQNYVKFAEEEIIQTLADYNKLNLSDKQIDRWHMKCL
jgi:hypothetical protein